MMTIAFSSHHAEVLPFARREMERHQVIVLEEPTSPNFSDMLEGRLPIDEYMLELDSGFPQFEKRMCAMLRELHHRGRQILQVEPYLDKLLRIHEHCAKGDRPEDVVKEPELAAVYAAERRATGVLLDYYVASLKASFDQVVEAVKAFAAADADRLKLREHLRAQAIKSIVLDDVDIYIEAGYIHFPLYLYLKRALGPNQKIRIAYLLAPIVRRLGGMRRNLGPGDLLTLHYALHGGAPKDVASLLAARSLIYIKLLQKDELLPGVSEAPHSKDMVRVNGIVDGLSFDDCHVLFDQLRLAKRERALEIVGAYQAGLHRGLKRA
jgi:hypothetical protein